MQVQYTGPLRFAHRGVVQAAPENTLGAFEAACGVEGIEIDVRLSLDGEVVVVHDSNLTRLTLGHPTGFSNAHIADLTWEELSRVELPYANHMLEEQLPPHSEIESLSIPPERLLGQTGGKSYLEELAKDSRMAGFMRFSDFATWLEKKPSLIAEIEIKASGVVEKIIEILAHSPVAERCILFSGNRAYIDEIQQVAAWGKPAGLKLGANFRVLTEELKEKIPSMDLYEVGLNDQRYTREDVEWLHAKGIKVFSNLGDYPQWWAEICTNGTDAFKTNYTQAFLNWWVKNHAPLQVNAYGG